jgi:MFS family permease
MTDQKVSTLHDEGLYPADDPPHKRSIISITSHRKDSVKPTEILKNIEHDVHFTLAEEKKVLRKIDLRILPIILFAYFLQQLDKSSLSYTSVFGIQQDAGLVGSQYSWLGSCLYLAQLIMQPLGAVLLVKYPTGKVISIAVMLWGITLCCMVACRSFGALLATRILLGSFEALIAPSLIAVTQMWWRRSEQTNRIMAWTSMNGVTAIVGSLTTYGLGHIASSVLRPYQIIFLFCGCLTLVFSVLCYIFMPDSPFEATFWRGKERAIAIERLRANQMGIVSREWRWDHVREALLDLKTYCWFIIIISISIPSGGITTFGPLIISAFGYDKFTTILFNTPFGAVQFIAIITSGIIATKIKKKGPVIIGLCIPAIIGCVMLLRVDRSQTGVLLFGFYLLSVYPAITPLIFSWSAANTAGDTKRKVTTAVMFIGLCTGNVIGPQLYQPSDSPKYVTGLATNLALFCCIAVFSM